jgi:hypothetical protein
MHRLLITFVLPTVACLFSTGAVLALEPIPYESGVGGFINLGVGGVTAKEIS